MAKDPTKIVRQIRTDDDEMTRSAYMHNGMSGKDYRKFAVVIDKASDRCHLLIEDIKGNVLKQVCFHVTPDQKHCWDSRRSPFYCNDDAFHIGRDTAYAFKPLLEKMGLVVNRCTIFAQVRINDFYQPSKTKEQ